MSLKANGHRSRCVVGGRYLEMVTVGVGNADEGLDTGDVLVADLLEVVEMRELEERGDKHVPRGLHVEQRAHADGALEAQQTQVDDLRVLRRLQQHGERRCSHLKKAPAQRQQSRLRASSSGQHACQ